MLPCGALLWWAFLFPSTSNGLFFLGHGTLRTPAGNLALAIHKNPFKTGPAQYKLAKKQAWDKNRVREECKHARLSKNLVLNRRGLPSMYSLNWRLMNNISLIFQVKLSPVAETVVRGGERPFLQLGSDAKHTFLFSFHSQVQCDFAPSISAQAGCRWHRQTLRGHCRQRCSFSYLGN